MTMLRSEKAYMYLKSGKLVARLGTGKFRCLFYPGKKKQDYPAAKEQDLFGWVWMGILAYAPGLCHSLPKVTRMWTAHEDMEGVLIFSTTNLAQASSCHSASSQVQLCGDCITTNPRGEHTYFRRNRAVPN